MIRMDNVQPCEAVTAQIKPGGWHVFRNSGERYSFLLSNKNSLQENNRK